MEGERVGLDLAGKVLLGAVGLLKGDEVVLVFDLLVPGDGEIRDLSGRSDVDLCLLAL